MHELLPAIESRFRGIGEGWARFTYGGSTGGWEALAVQVLYPDAFNGCFAACPDPIDCRAYCLTDIYNDPNCYYTYALRRMKPLALADHLIIQPFDMGACPPEQGHERIPTGAEAVFSQYARAGPIDSGASKPHGACHRKQDTLGGAV